MLVYYLIYLYLHIGIYIYTYIYIYTASSKLTYLWKNEDKTENGRTSNGLESIKKIGDETD